MTVKRDQHEAIWKGKRTTCAHLVSDLLDPDAARAELVEVAERIGLKASWIQHAGTYREHFDLIGLAPIGRADAAGVGRFEPRELGLLLRRKREHLEALRRQSPAQLVLTTPTEGEPVPLVDRRAYPPAWLGKATHAQAVLAMRGLHPTGRALHPDEATRCGSCAHLVRRSASKTYLKCEIDRPRWTAGRGTDLRAKWRGCERFEREGDT